MSPSPSPPSSVSARAPARREARARAGMTLVEILIVLSLIALVSGAVVAGTGQMAGSRLRQSATMLTGAVRVAYTRATATSRSVRLVFDFEHEQFWLEEASRPMLVKERDVTGTGGADPATEVERAALAEGERITAGPRIPKPAFQEVEAFGLSGNEGKKGKKPLARGVRFRAVQTPHDDEARTEGRAYLYFWPGGRTERASIQLVVGERDDDARTLTLMVSPLTGKVTIKEGAVELPKVDGDTPTSEREDKGGTF